MAGFSFLDLKHDFVICAVIKEKKNYFLPISLFKNF